MPEWSEHFLDLLKERGYEDVEIWHDPAYGWTVNYGAGEFEAPSTTIVAAKIRALPVAVSSSVADPDLGGLK